MTRPVSKPSHELIVQTPKGSSHYKVVETDKLQDGIAEVTIIAGDWLDMGTYTATYQVGENRARGSFSVYACRSSLEQIRFVGTFMREGVTRKGGAEGPSVGTAAVTRSTTPAGALSATLR